MNNNLEESILQRLMSGFGIEGKKQFLEIIQKKNDILFNLKRIDFLKQEISISKNLHITSPNSFIKENGKIWIEECNYKIEFIENYLWDKYKYRYVV